MQIFAENLLSSIFFNIPDIVQPVKITIVKTISIMLTSPA